MLHDSHSCGQSNAFDDRSQRDGRPLTSSITATLRRLAVASAGCVLLIHTPGSVGARPEAPLLFCTTYPTIPACEGKVPSCATCHSSVLPVSWNDFGLSLLPHLGSEPFETALGTALQKVEEEDADGDGIANIDELVEGSDPADPTSQLDTSAAVAGNYDPVFAFRRVSALYCGRSPTYEQMQDIRALSSVDDQRAMVHAALDECLRTDYWRKVALFRLADTWVRPIKVFGPETDFEPQPGIKAILGDYRYEYRLFSYVMTDERDARELVTAQYHIEEADDGSWERVEGVVPPNFPGNRGGQPLEPQYRAGMMTAQWTVVTNVMLTAVPRVLTGHIYRAYLGLDISLTEGLLAVSEEPLDVDRRGVSEPGCAVCHSTIDPATYPLAYLVGLDAFTLGFPPPVAPGSFDPDRPSRMLPDWWDEAQPEGVFLGESVSSPAEVGTVIANAPAFHRNLAETFFRHAIGRTPGPADFEEFGALWRDFESDGYAVNRMLHRLVDTNAFGFRASGGRD